MSSLGALLAALFAGFFEFAVKYFTREIALRVAFGTMWVSGAALLFVALHTAMAALTYTMPEGLASALLFVFPGNVNTCIAALISVEATCAGFKVYMLGFGK